MLVSAIVEEAGGKQRQPYIESAQARRVASRVAHVVGETSSEMGPRKPLELQVAMACIYGYYSHLGSLEAKDQGNRVEGRSSCNIRAKCERIKNKDCEKFSSKVEWCQCCFILNGGLTCPRLLRV